MLNTVFKKKLAGVLVGLVFIAGLVAVITSAIVNGVPDADYDEWAAPVTTAEPAPATISNLHKELGEAVPATLLRSETQLASMVTADCNLLAAVPASVGDRDNQVESLIAGPLTSFSPSDARFIARKVISFCYESGKA